MSFFTKFFDREPIVIYGLVNAILITLTTFGLSLSDAQTGSILLLVNAILVFAGRQSVVPVATNQAQVSNALYSAKPNVENLTQLSPPAVEAKKDIAKAEEVADSAQGTPTPKNL